jgi:hypothetical protein
MIKPKLADIVGALDEQSDGICHYLERNTALIHAMTDEIKREVKANKNTDPSHWLAPYVTLIKNIKTNKETFIKLPSQYDIHEYAIMENFAESLDEVLSQKVFDAIRGSGAFKRFKRCIYTFDLDEKWYAYRHAALEKIARDWCARHGVGYVE